MTFVTDLNSCSFSAQISSLPEVSCSSFSCRSHWPQMRRGHKRHCLCSHPHWTCHDCHDHSEGDLGDGDHARTSTASETGTLEAGEDTGQHKVREAGADHCTCEDGSHNARHIEDSLRHVGLGDKNLRGPGTSPSCSSAAWAGALPGTSGMRSVVTRSCRDAGGGGLMCPSSGSDGARSHRSHANVHLASDHEHVSSLCLNTTCHHPGSLTARWRAGEGCPPPVEAPPASQYPWPRPSASGAARSRWRSWRRPCPPSRPPAGARPPWPPAPWRSWSSPARRPGAPAASRRGGGGWSDQQP